MPPLPVQQAAGGSGGGGGGAPLEQLWVAVPLFVGRQTVCWVDDQRGGLQHQGLGALQESSRLQARTCDCLPPPRPPATALLGTIDMKVRRKGAQADQLRGAVGAWGCKRAHVVPVCVDACSGHA